MSRTFRNKKIKPTKIDWFYTYENEHFVQWDLPYLKLRRVTRVEHENLEKQFYLLYRDKHHVSYTYYRKRCEMAVKTLCRKELNKYLQKEDYEIQLPKFNKIGDDWWD